MPGAVAYARDEAVENAFHRVKRIVHEGVLALAALPPVQRPAQSGNAWPDYVYDFNEHGAHDREEKFRPTPDQIDYAYKVNDWYGAYRDRGRDRNGLLKWQWTLLQVRAWQEVFGRPSWRSVETSFSNRSHLPTMSYEKLRQEHKSLIDIAYAQAIKAGDVFV